MFDDFKQDKTDKELDILSSSPLPLNKKLALSLATCSILFLFAWHTYDSASSTAQSENSFSAIVQLTKRVEILEQTPRRAYYDGFSKAYRQRL